MNPLWVQIGMSVGRSVLLSIFAFFVAKGWMTQDQANSEAARLATILVPLLGTLVVTLWGAFRAKAKQKLLVTAQAMPGPVTTEQVQKAARLPAAPPANLAPNVTPSPLPAVYSGPIKGGSNDAA
jgi:hypothetical protein